MNKYNKHRVGNSKYDFNPKYVANFIKEESKMKIDVSNITDNTAVHCPKIEYIEPLFKAMGEQSSIPKAKKYWQQYKESICFEFDIFFHVSSKSWYENEGYTIIEFTDLNSLK